MDVEVISLTFEASDEVGLTQLVDGQNYETYSMQAGNDDRDLPSH